MPKYFVDKNGNYFETLTDVATAPGNSEIVQRPSRDHQLQNGGWVYVAPVPEVVEPDPVIVALELITAEMPTAKRGAITAEINKAKGQRG